MKPSTNCFSCTDDGSQRDVMGNLKEPISHPNYIVNAHVYFVRGGKSQTRPRANIRIIGGNVSTVDQFPWQVSLQILGLHNCGGSIISEDTILTAAHCIDGLNILERIVAGSSLLSEPQVIVGIKESFTHENYNYLDYDVGIIKLAEKLNFSETIQPVKLAEARPADGAPVTVSGYGVTWEGSIFTSNELRSVEVNIVNQEECNNDYAEYDGVTQRMICAAVPEGGKDACQGDSGGPLVNADRELVGIVSWGLGCAVQGYPGVYTSVADLREWIVEKAGL
ncbi:trypsin beta-like isoform X3 [Aethina tumida]|uniref:trypsin beta-like isoform X3 n=1 Tax=Aethina tumida TaxID=116153 RepID=UPI0021490FAD|nr:trypsin beta-like isoform X3 [Aethina tumida]